MRIAFEEVPDGGVFTQLVPVSNGKNRAVVIEFPSWDFRQYEGTIVQAHLDPDIDDLAIMVTSSGILWPFDHYRRIPPKLRIEDKISVSPD